MRRSASRRIRLTNRSVHNEIKLTLLSSDIELIGSLTYLLSNVWIRCLSASVAFSDSAASIKDGSTAQ